ncbi:uncharacterized protein LOC110962559 [Acanthochromis polyacanthus]|uniref:uncharacterized protein LOC110962559 n=1 Tax=Acanthochromis polyacanthus TaxID=80966 RepID=UPI0022349FF6|nr:uncharacterized protein LOC110962559 [Acanthochromis polyacanthus]
MEDRSSTQSFSNLHHHHRRPSFPIALPSFQSSEGGYLSSQPPQDPLEQFGSRGEESTTSFLTSNSTSGPRRTSSGGDRVYLNTSTSSLDGDASLGGHLDGDGGLGGHFDDTWYSSIKKEAWDDGESCESPAEDFHGKNDCNGNTNEVFYMMNCEEGARRRVRPNYNNYSHASCEAKSESLYNREANLSHFMKQTNYCNRSGGGSFNDSNVDYCRTDSRVSDNYLGGEEDYGSSCGSGEDQLQRAEVEAPWLSVSPLSQEENRWRVAADSHSLASGYPSQRSHISINSRTYTQKLDSFSEAFHPQRKRKFPVIPGGDTSGQMWEFGGGRGETPGLIKSRQSCAFDSDSYQPPSSSSSPAHPSHPSFPSPPTSSHLMSSVLSPPPTPLPPPSHSPSKMDSPGAFGSIGHAASQGESLGTLQFFTPRLQSVPSGMILKFPLLSHCFPQSSEDSSSDPSRSSHGDDYGHIAATRDILQCPESSFLTSPSHRSSLHPSRALQCPSSGSSLLTSFHLPPHASLLSGQHHEAAEKKSPYVTTQKVKNGPASLNQTHLPQQATPVYTGTPFPSILHSSRGQKRGRYTPRPLLNPVRRGTGLYSTLTSSHHREEETASGQDEEPCGVLLHVNVGPDFQADLPPYFGDGGWSSAWSPQDETPREQLLWKPWDNLEENAHLQNQVEKLLSMCSSSCLPGGGSNTELALHCLHYCQGNTMATLEMLLFSQPSPTGDYHYSGCDFWTDTERNLFSATLGTYGKNFSLIEKTVGTKTVRQCVEFYYMSKKLLDKQKKQKEEESRDGVLEQQKHVTPICQPMGRRFTLEEAVPVPPLASYFPCKLCGKMFYKIKSRNAHMKIHRQPQEDWADRRLQQQLLTQRLALSCPTSLMQTPASNLLPPPAAPALTFSPSGLPGTSNNNSNADHNSVTSSNPITPTGASVLDPSTAVTYNSIAPPNSHVIANIDGSDANQTEPTSVLPFHQSWGSFGHPPNQAMFYCSAAAKEDVGAGTVAGKETIDW